MHAIVSVTTETTPPANRYHAPLEAPSLYLRPGVHLLETLVNSRLLNETGVYLGEASIRAHYNNYYGMHIRATMVALCVCLITMLAATHFIYM